MITLNISIRWYHSIPFLGSWLLRRQVAARVVHALALKLLEGSAPCLCEPKDGEGKN